MSLPSPSLEDVEQAVRTLIRWTGDDPMREGLLETPKRIATSFKELYAGYDVDPVAFLTKTFQEIHGYDEIIILRDMLLFSHCEHHMLPIIGRVHVGYLPHHRVVGISKLGHVVRTYAKRLQIQEKLTAQIANTINDVLQPRGVGVVIEAEHLCITLRGLQMPGVKMITSRMLGDFRTDPSIQRTFVSMINTPSSPSR